MVDGLKLTAAKRMGVSILLAFVAELGIDIEADNLIPVMSAAGSEWFNIDSKAVRVRRAGASRADGCPDDDCYLSEQSHVPVVELDVLNTRHLGGGEYNRDPLDLGVV